MAGFVLDIYIEWIVRFVLRFAREFGAERWPIHQAKVTGAFCPKVGYGCEKAEINYTYSIDGETHLGSNVKPFIVSNSARKYAEQFPKGKRITVRVKPSNPSFSVLVDSENAVEIF